VWRQGRERQAPDVHSALSSMVYVLRRGWGFG